MCVLRQHTTHNTHCAHVCVSTLACASFCAWQSDQEKAGLESSTSAGAGVGELNDDYLQTFTECDQCSRPVKFDWPRFSLTKLHTQETHKRHTRDTLSTQSGLSNLNLGPGPRIVFVATLPLPRHTRTPVPLLFCTTTSPPQRQCHTGTSGCRPKVLKDLIDEADVHARTHACMRVGMHACLFAARHSAPVPGSGSITNAYTPCLAPVSHLKSAVTVEYSGAPIAPPCNRNLPNPSLHIDPTPQPPRTPLDARDARLL